MYTPISKQEWIWSLKKHVPLPSWYIRFEFRDATMQKAAIDHLKEGLDRVFTRWPFFAGQVIHSTHPPKVMLLYTKDRKHFNINHYFGNEIFNHEHLKEPQDSYRQLVGLDIPPRFMKADCFTLSPKHPKPDGICHPLTLKATFIEGGLLLGFGFHHTLCDGISIRQILSTFGNLDSSAMTPDTPSLDLRNAFINKYSLSGSSASAVPTRKVQSTFASAMNLRGSRGPFPDLPQTYISNMFHRAFTILPMPSLLYTHPKDPTGISTLAEVALYIKANVPDLLFKKTPQKILGEPDRPAPHTGLDCSPWALLELNIPGTESKWPGSKSDWARKT
ncbi:hypothetical protein QBC40DRAFT_330882 [Triangularia verruculosa]|uniref:Trichothecene 3-O-acetyltransferase-like N-terminal domain-containing protein n=1 Tax=Triangularia verruculosa TaxID=2587418 RepID=A0AAN7B137_9PEZI|nr:hypothetical protein QBC40DRAFT_330882 [Triangularia verruculosa]